VTYRFIHPSPWTDYIRAPKLCRSHTEHSFQMPPIPHIGVLVYGAGAGFRGGSVVGDELFGFGAEGQVCEEDVAAVGEEEFGEGEVDSCDLN